MVGKHSASWLDWSWGSYEECYNKSQLFCAVLDTYTICLTCSATIAATSSPGYAILPIISGHRLPSIHRPMLIPTVVPKRHPMQTQPDISYTLSRSLLISTSTDCMSLASSGPWGLNSSGMCSTAASRAAWKLRTEDDRANMAFLRTLFSLSEVAIRTSLGIAPTTRSWD